MNVMVAAVWSGGGERYPRSQVARIPPAWAARVNNAMAVAHQACGVLLFTSHVVRAGGPQHIPGTDRKRDA